MPFFDSLAHIDILHMYIYIDLLLVIFFLNTYTVRIFEAGNLQSNFNIFPGNRLNENYFKFYCVCYNIYQLLKHCLYILHLIHVYIFFLIYNVKTFCICIFFLNVIFFITNLALMMLADNDICDIITMTVYTLRARTNRVTNTRLLITN